MSDTKVTVHEAFAAVMAEVSAVGKDGRNTQQNYSFRGIDGVVNAVGPALRKHSVAIIPRTLSASYRDVTVGKNNTPQREATVHVEYTVYGPGGDSFSGATYGEALDSGDKATAKAHSVAYRTFLLQALTIPTHEPDPDESSPERSAPPPPPPPWNLVTAKRLLVALLGDKTEAGACWKANVPEGAPLPDEDEVRQMAAAWPKDAG